MPFEASAQIKIIQLFPLSPLEIVPLKLSLKSFWAKKSIFPDEPPIFFFNLDSKEDREVET